MTLKEVGPEYEGEPGDGRCEGTAGPADSTTRGLVQRVREIVGQGGERDDGELSGGPEQPAGEHTTSLASRVVDTVVEVASSLKG